jgi:hypothetical protein
MKITRIMKGIFQKCLLKMCNSRLQETWQACICIALKVALIKHLYPYLICTPSMGESKKGWQHLSLLHVFTLLRSTCLDRNQDNSPPFQPTSPLVKKYFQLAPRMAWLILTCVLWYLDSFPSDASFLWIYIVKIIKTQSLMVLCRW